MVADDKTQSVVKKRKMQRDLDRLPMHALKKLHSTDKQDWLTMKTLKNGC